MSTAIVIDAWPAEATLRIVKGDPFALRVVLRDDDGQAVDVTGWEWRATISAGLGGSIRLDFGATEDDDGLGVRLWLRGEDTSRLPTLRPWPFDVSCRAPTAGEGVMVLAGEAIVRARTTDPLRHDPDTSPRDTDELVPA